MGHMSDPERDDSKGARVSRIGPLGIVTIVVTVLVTIALGVLYYFRFVERFLAEYSTATHTVDSAFEVQAHARKFDWHFHYAGPDGLFGATSPTHVRTDNPIGLDPSDPHAYDDIVTTELVLPCEVSILIRSHSTDVIHTLGKLQGSFALDCIPGVPADALLQTPTSPASGTLRCTTLCGAGHSSHHAPFRFLSEADYESWYEAQVIATQSTKPPPVPKPGR